VHADAPSLAAHIGHGGRFGDPLPHRRQLVVRNRRRQFRRFDQLRHRRGPRRGEMRKKRKSGQGCADRSPQYHDKCTSGLLLAAARTKSLSPTPIYPTLPILPPNFLKSYHRFTAKRTASLPLLSDRPIMAPKAPRIVRLMQLAGSNPNASRCRNGGFGSRLMSGQESKFGHATTTFVFLLTADTWQDLSGK
jgi:hypothetical protein